MNPIALPEVTLANAIWGATGRDDLGNVYFGVSCDGGARLSATLLRVEPGADEAVVMGDAVTQLERLGLALSDDGVTQMKIHGKPVQANDGFLYFASMDETGEKSDGSQLPFHGSHLWRIDPKGPVDQPWEHLMAAPEALLATACTGRYVYAFGYFQHTLYQWDTQASATAEQAEAPRKLVVGSVGGHVSRNFLVDLQEHAYVPRVSEVNGELQVELVEFDELLQEVVAHPLEGYEVTPNFDSHGIVGFAALKSGDFVFTTTRGALYHLHPRVGEPSELERLGWIHPDGEAYASALVCPDGETTLAGVVKRPKGKEYEWVVFDLEQRQSQVLPLSAESQQLLSRPHTLVYGNNTLDDLGHAYLVGWHKVARGRSPYVLQVSWDEASGGR